MSNPAVYESEDRFAVNRKNVVAVRLTDDGTPTGSAEMVGDYSVTPGLFWATVPQGVRWYVRTMVVYVAGAGNVTANGYGPAPALASGLLLQFEDSDLVPLIPPFPLTLKINGDFQQIGFELTVQDTGPGINHVTFRFDFERGNGTHLILDAGDRLAARPADNLTGLSSHNVFISGYSLVSLVSP